MERAAVYIREGRWTMQQVAELVGIPNYRTFFNAFRRVMGASPSEFGDRFRSRMEA
jgi:AraC-like DNA-binding protein